LNLKLTEEDPGTEIVAQAAAALAATSVAWQPYHPEYAQLCLTHAIQLYQFATNHMRSFMESTQPGFLVTLDVSYPFHSQ
jgi:endoglucanase